MRVTLVAHSFDKLARGVIGDELDVADDVGERLIARGTAKKWQPPQQKTNSVAERLTELESRVKLLESKDGER